MNFTNNLKEATTLYKIFCLIFITLISTWIIELFYISTIDIPSAVAPKHAVYMSSGVASGTITSKPAPAVNTPTHP